MAARNPGRGGGIDFSPPPGGATRGGGGGVVPGGPSVSIPTPNLPPPRNIDATPAPRPAPETGISVPTRGGGDMPPRTGPDGADLPPGQRGPGGDAPPAGGRDAAPGAPAPSLTQRARNMLGGAAGSVGMGVGITGLTLALQTGAQLGMTQMGLNAANKTVAQVLDFLGEPLNLAIVAGVIAVVVIAR